MVTLGISRRAAEIRHDLERRGEADRSSDVDFCMTSRWCLRSHQFRRILAMNLLALATELRQVNERLERGSELDQRAVRVTAGGTREEIDAAVDAACAAH